jgi:hypothetical protein
LVIVSLVLVFDPFFILLWPAALMLQVEFESALEHPFFVLDQGWASCYPERTLQCYGLKCHRLQVGDVCVSLTPRTKSTRRTENTRKRRWSAPDQFCNDDDDEPSASASMKRKKDWTSRRYLTAVFLCHVHRHCAGDLSVCRHTLRLVSIAIHWWAFLLPTAVERLACVLLYSGLQAVQLTPSFVVTDDSPVSPSFGWQVVCLTDELLCPLYNYGMAHCFAVASFYLQVNMARVLREVGSNSRGLGIKISETGTSLYVYSRELHVLRQLILLTWCSSYHSHYVSVFVPTALVMLHQNYG